MTHVNPAPDDDMAREAFNVGAGAALVALTIAVLVALVGCAEPSITREPVTTGVPSGDRQNAINRLCHRYSSYTITELGTAQVEGDITYYAGLRGVPPILRDVVTGYWDDPRVRDTKPRANHQVAETRNATVIATCENYGWARGVKASDQPPRPAVPTR